ncbi:MAG: hypothetical protein COB50_04240, partial [Thiotrichales bacterium]
MAISAYTGLPGHGKSYGVVDNVIVPALKQKRLLFTNIPMNNELCLERYGIAPIFFDIDDFVNDENWITNVFEKGAILVIDEVWRLWPAGLRANKAREHDKSLLAEHRHMVGENGMSTEIILVTQDLSQVASFVRALIETTYRVTKMTNLGMSKRYRVDVYYGAITGSSPPVSKRTREIFGKFDKKVFELYTSHTMSATGEAGTDKQIDERLNIFSGSKIKYYVIFMIILLIVSYKGISNAFTGAQPEKDEQQEILQTDKSLRDIEIQKIKNDAEQEHKIKLQNELRKLKELKESEFLYNSSSVVIIYNNGTYPKIEYQFKVE